MGALKPSIVFVDDDPRSLRSLEAMFMGQYNVFLCENTKIAKQVLDSQPVEVVIVDEFMPIERGHELLEWMTENHIETSKIVMSGYMDDADLVRSLKKLKVDYLIDKPWSNSDLSSKIRELVNLSQKKSEIAKNAQNSSTVLLNSAEEQKSEKTLKLAVEEYSQSLISTENISEFESALLSMENPVVAFIDSSIGTSSMRRAIKLIQTNYPHMATYLVIQPLEGKAALKLKDKHWITGCIFKSVTQKRFSCVLEKLF